MHASGGSGYCDCGDPEAWRADPYCEVHKPVSSDQMETDNPEKTGFLPPDVEKRLSGLVLIVLRYCVELLTWEKAEDLPAGLKVIEKVILPYQTILFNDEYHTYDQVGRIL